MKYPQSFALVDRGDGMTCKVTYDSASGVYLQDYHDGESPEQRTEEDIAALVHCSYDIRYEYPNHFSFTHDTTSQMYDMVKIGDDQWGCSLRGEPYEHLRNALYTAEEIAESFAKGYWKEVSFTDNLVPSEPIKVADEPVEEILEVRVNGVVQGREMKFPFTIVTPNDNWYDISEYTSDHGYVTMTAHGVRGKQYHHVTKDMAKQSIKSGAWIVTSVGPQKASEAPTSDSYELPKPTRPAPPMPAVNLYKGIGGDEIEAPTNLLEVSKSTIGNVSKLSLKINNKDAVDASERLERLADATERLNIALESFASIFADVQGILGGSRANGCVTFCCKEN